MKPVLFWYVRLSRDEAKKDTDSINNQIQLGEDRATEWGYSLKLYNEGIQSGKDENRPVMKLLMADILEDGKPGDAIGFKNQNRLARNIEIWSKWLRVMSKLGYPIYDEKKKDLTQHQLESKIIGVVDEKVIEDGRTANRLMTERKLKQNLPFAGIPFGYKKKHIKLASHIKKTWQLDNKKSEVVKKLYDYAIQQERIDYQAIAKHFDMARSTVRKILNNKAYIGIRNIKGKEYELEKDIPRIITKKEFEELQNKINK